MKKIFFISTFMALFAFMSCAQNNQFDKAQNAVVMFYNVENLFDTIDDPAISDEDFLPTSEKKWTAERYNAKLAKLALVIAGVSANELPELVGLCEVENANVLSDLCQQKSLANGNYKFVHFDSKDTRGIDVALMYRSDEFEPVVKQSLPVIFTDDPDYKTRDILYVKGKLSGEEVHVFVNHWKSRRGGNTKTEPKRVASAEVVRKKADEILKADKNAKIIIMGDLNDTPTDKSVFETLNATNNQHNTQNNELYNLMYDLAGNKQGTHNYRGNWSMLDNLIVSQAFFADKGYTVSRNGGQIFRPRWILHDNSKAGDFVPNRTYGGKNYYGGYSDHLPIYVQLKKY